MSDNSPLPIDLYARVLRFSTDPGPLLHALIGSKKHMRAIWSMAFPGSFQHAVYHCCVYGDVKLLCLLVSRAPKYSVERVNWARMCAVCPLKATENTLEITSATTAFILKWTPIMHLLSADSFQKFGPCTVHPFEIVQKRRRAEIKELRKRRNTDIRNARMQICVHRGHIHN